MSDLMSTVFLVTITVTIFTLTAFLKAISPLRNSGHYETGVVIGMLSMILFIFGCFITFIGVELILGAAWSKQVELLPGLPLRSVLVICYLVFIIWMIRAAYRFGIELEHRFFARTNSAKRMGQ